MGEPPSGNYGCGEDPSDTPTSYSDKRTYRKSCAYGDPTYNGSTIPVIQVGLGLIELHQ